jgi:uncharacterized protein (TIGR00645 family)
MKPGAAESFVERGLFAARWLMAPFYLLMVLALAALLVKFCQELFATLPDVLSMKDTDVILWLLTLIDLSLAGNLLLMVVFSGYENFVSKMDVGDHHDRPDWMGKVDFSGLKLKLIASVVAISGIHLLKSFMSIGKAPITPDKQTELMWLVIIHLVFVVSGVLLALMDLITASAAKNDKATMRAGRDAA